MLRRVALVRTTKATWRNIQEDTILYLLYFLNLSSNTRPLSGIQLCQLISETQEAFSRGLRPSVLFVSLLKSVATIPLLQRIKTAHFTHGESISIMQWVLPMFAMILNSVFLFRKLIVVEFLLGMADTLPGPVSAPRVLVTTATLPDVHPLLTFLAGIVYVPVCVLLTHILSFYHM
jgi:hypothetical protein